ncbi:MAG TPA: polysaccharide deacetylase family protein [Verrucomicrobiae bacterium]|nr:polysaccharide deacetylase family protein [Verrucomicrobiae bacterium]
MLTYHGVVDRWTDERLERNLHLTAEFASQATYLRRGRVITMPEVSDSLRLPTGFSRRAVAITFDDGYRNNLEAVRILAEAKMPCTIFVTTGSIGTGNVIWTVELSLLLLHGDNKRKIDVLGKVWPLESRKDREETFQTIRYPLKAMPASQRREAMDVIRGQFPRGETGRLLDQYPAFQMLDWKQIGELAAAGVEIGSHGVEHEIHHSAQQPEVRRHELLASKQEIERRLGRPCRFFAFPNGDTCATSAQEVRDAGYELGFTTCQNCIGGGFERGTLPRLTPGGSAAKLQLQFNALG